MKKIGENLFFLLIISSYAIYHYINTNRLTRWEEKIAVRIVFWIFISFVLIHIILLIFRERHDFSFEKIPSLKKISELLVRDKKNKLLIGTIIYLFLIPQLGFIIASYLFLLSFYWIFGTKKLVIVIFLPFLLLSFIYIIFIYFLRLRIPAGPLG